MRFSVLEVDPVISGKATSSTASSINGTVNKVIALDYSMTCSRSKCHHWKGNAANLQKVDIPSGAYPQLPSVEIGLRIRT